MVLVEAFKEHFQGFFLLPSLSYGHEFILGQSQLEETNT
jgi:hypothetical protein